MDTTSIILKTDSRGLVRMPLRRREELLLEFERSVCVTPSTSDLRLRLNLDRYAALR